MTSEFDRLQAALPKRYTLLRELDRGGMSRVYLARESLPDRDVAIKVFDEELSARLGRERFVREVELTSKLSHPHIVPIYAAGEADGTLYYVMPFIRGESLRDRLDREGTLPVKDALRVAEQVADALGHAHEMGIVHRDVKPANILFQSGHAVVADFGIARALRAAGTGDLTVSGITVGTPDYMSPEQASGDQKVDARTDTYALGCVLYEMLGGQPPFHSRTPQATLARHITDAVPSLRALRDSLPEEIEETIRRALSKDPADRHPTTFEFADELRRADSGGFAAADAGAGRSPWDGLGLSLRVAGTLLVVAALGIAWSAWSSNEPVGIAAANRYQDSVAVMPFDNRTGDPALEGVGLSMAEEVISHLWTVSSVKVIGSYSVASLYDQRLGLTLLMDTLNVGHLIDGFFTIREGGVVLTVQEFDAEGVVHDMKLYPIPAGPLDSVRLVIAHDVADRFLQRIGISESFAAADVAYGPARDAYLAGINWLGERTAPALRRALTQLNEAARLQPDYAPAHAALSNAYALGLYYKYDLGMSAYDLAAMAFVSADRAIAIDPDFANGYSARGMITGLVEADVEAAQADFDRAGALEPNNPNAPSWSSRILAQRGLVDEAFGEARRARDLDPVQAGRRMALASLAFQLAEYEVVVQEAAAAASLQPSLTLARAFQARGLGMLGRTEECLALELGVYEVVYAICLHRAGRVSEAAALAERAETALTSGGGDVDHLDDVVMQDLASYYALVGNVERATRWMVMAFGRSPTGIDSKILDSELFDPVRDQSEFRQALAGARRDALQRIAVDRARLGNDPG